MDKPSTLGDWKKFADILGGKAAEFIDKKIAKEGKDARVIAADSQVILLLVSLATEKPEPQGPGGE